MMERKGGVEGVETIVRMYCLREEKKNNRNCGVHSPSGPDLVVETGCDSFITLQIIC